MKIEQMPSRYTTRSSNVVLETEAERALSNDQLITLCDNLEGIEYNHETKSYSLTGKSFGTPHHFGGRVQRNGDTCTVTVYVD
jgi:hypothetical protein